MDHPLNPYTMFFFFKKNHFLLHNRTPPPPYTHAHAHTRVYIGDYREKFPCQVFWEIWRALAFYGIYKNIC